MFKFTNNPILLPHQMRILQLFFSTTFGKPFFLTGGTALADKKRAITLLQQSLSVNPNYRFARQWLKRLTRT